MDLRTALHVVRTTWVSIVLITVAGAVLAFAFAMTQPKTYRANASGIVVAGVSSDLGSALAGENLAKSRVKSYLDVAHSRTVAQRVIDELDLDTSPQALVGQVSAANPIDTAVIQVTVSARQPELAATIAEAWIAGIAEEIAEIENSGTAGSGATSVIKFRSLDSAVVPSAPSSPNVPLIVAIGCVIGLAIGVGQAFVRAALDRRIRRPNQIEAELGLSVVGSIPRSPAIDDGKRIASAVAEASSGREGDIAFAVAESLRELRTNLQFMDVDDPPRLITITSSLPGEGKSTVAANLARAIAANGDPVILVDGDLRRPTVARTFGLPTGVGLTDVLIGRADIDDVLQVASEDGLLQVLGAGSTPPNPSELLGSQAMRHVLEELRERALVLVDAPPLLPVTDAAVLSVVTDGALLVGRCGRTTLDSASQALQNIDRVRGRALGFIINAVPLRGGRSYTYSYKYKYDYRSEPTGNGDGPGPQGSRALTESPDDRTTSGPKRAA